MLQNYHCLTKPIVLKLIQCRQNTFLQSKVHEIMQGRLKTVTDIKGTILFIQM